MINIKNRDSIGIMDYPAPDWLRNAVIVELPVRGFNCSDYKDRSKWKYAIGDGTFNSLAKKLDFKDKGLFIGLDVHKHRPS